MMDSTPNFTPRAQEALKSAKRSAIKLRSDSVDIQHLLLGLVSQSRYIIFKDYLEKFLI